MGEEQMKTFTHWLTNLEKCFNLPIVKNVNKALTSLFFYRHLSNVFVRKDEFTHSAMMLKQYKLLHFYWKPID